MKSLFILLSAVLCLASANTCIFPNTMYITMYNSTNYPESSPNPAPGALMHGPIIYQGLDVPTHTATTSPIIAFTNAPSAFYSATWDGYVISPLAGKITFLTLSDDGWRVYLDGVLACDNWNITSASTKLCISNAGPYTLGQAIAVHIEWFQYQTRQGFILQWSYTGSGGVVNVPATSMYYSNCTVYNIAGNSSVTLDTGLGSAAIDYALTGQPNGTVTLDITSNCLLQSACSLSYDMDNYNVPQSINVYPNPNSASTCCNVTVTASSDDVYDGKTFTTQVCKTTSNTTTGISYGDPHFDTFDGNVHTFISLGDFYVLRQSNGDFVIQNRQVTCSTAACNGQIAIRYKTYVLYLTIDQTTGTPSASQVGDMVANGVTVTASGTTYTFICPTGAYVNIQVGYWSQRRVFFLDVYVTLPNFYKGQIYGLLGFFDGVKSNDYTMRNGTVITAYANIPIFQESWRVPTSEDLFISATASIPAIFGASSSNNTIVSCGNAPTPTGTVNVTNSTVPPTANDTVPFSNQTFDCNVFTNATVQAAAIAACAPYFNNSCCDSIGVNSTAFYLTCLCDYNIAGGPDFVGSDAAAYSTACTAAQASTHVSCQTCPNGCSGHGTCNAGVCNCSTGYNGTDCSQDLNVCTNVSSISPASGGRMCSNTLTVSGINFQASTLYCLFSTSTQNITVVATKVTNFQVTCHVPTGLNNNAKVYVYQNGSCFQSVATYTLANYCCDGPSASALSWGDPHIDTFDGMVYTFLDYGDYYFLRQASGDLVIQASQVACSVAACNGAVAVRFMSLVFYVALEGDVNGIPVATTNADVHAYNVAISMSSDHKKFIMTLPTGAIITIQSLPWAALGLYYLNVQATLPASYKNTVFGLGGYFDGNTTNDFVDASGHVQTQANVLNFARSWAVPTAQNLWTNPAASIPAIFGGSTPLTVAPSSCSNSSNSNVPTSTAAPPHNVTQQNNTFNCLNFTNATLLAAAVADCSYFNNTCCNSLGINGTAYYQNCLCDYNVANGDSLLEGAVESYSALCTQLATAHGTSCTTPTLPPTTPPPNPCTIVDSISPLNANLYCFQNITVTGSGFLAATLSCSFGGTIVPAWKIDDTTAICPVPPVLLNDVTVSIISGTQCNQSSTQVTLNNMCCSNPVSTSISWGDPHINTIDGNFFTTYVPVGNYYFIRQTNGDLVIQTSQVACSTAYCNSNAAIRFLNTEFYINFTAATGAAHFYTVGDYAANGVTISSTTDRYTITLPTKVTIKLQVLPWAALSIYYLDVTVSLPSNYEGFIYGLAGSFNGNAADDFTGLDGVVYGTSQAQINLFSATWAVPASEDLWLNSNAVIPSFFNGGASSQNPPQACYVPPPSPTAPPAYCPAVTDDFGVWGRGAFGATVYGQCLTGFVGAPHRVCYSNSTFGPVSNQCVPSANNCPVDLAYDHADWPATNVGQFATGTCNAGFWGSPQRKCNIDSTWASSVSNYCTQNNCSAITEGGATWALQTPTNIQVTGTCIAPNQGTVRRMCNLDGSWGAITGTCAAPNGCDSGPYGRATFPSATPGQTVTGTCNTGSHNAAGGAPTRKCNADSTWSTLVQNNCVVSQCPAGTYSAAGYPAFTLPNANPNQVVTGTCVTGSGAPQRYCDPSGTWTTFRGTPCA